MKHTAASTGIIVGLISALIIFFTYISGPESMDNRWIGVLSLILTMGTAVFLGIQHRNQTGGFMSYKSALVFLVIVGVIAMAVQFLVQTVLYDVIDPEFLPKAKEIVVENMVDEMIEKGTPEHIIDMSVGFVESGFDSQMTISGRLLGTGFQLLIWGVISLLLALIIKKNKPEFA